jgi:exodeoxyribonuclease-3
LCLQETKLSDKISRATFSGLGYESVHNGQGQWNGVAICRAGIDNVTNGFDDQHVDPYEGDARALAPTAAACDS